MIYRTTLKRDGKPLASLLHTDLSRPRFDDMGRETAHQLRNYNATHFRTDALMPDYWHKRTRWTPILAGSI